MKDDIAVYHGALSTDEQNICALLRQEIDLALPDAESTIWHAHPVWFLVGNPIVGYSKQKAGIRLMFWSGADFDEMGLAPGTGKFKDASAIYTSVDDIDLDAVRRWLAESRNIQWDYKNIVKNKGKLHQLPRDL
ncbi:MAG: DUF1801 domain-containing protein [Microbacteriaceae bacterium]